MAAGSHVPASPGAALGSGENQGLGTPERVQPSRRFDVLNRCPIEKENPMPEEKPSAKPPVIPGAKEAPASPKVVQKTKELKTPREIQLETALQKELAYASDRLTALEGWKTEMDAYLAGDFSVARKPEKPVAAEKPAAGSPGEAPKPAARTEYDRWMAGEMV